MIDWDAQPLGKETDRAIAARVGVTYQAVSLQRKKRGIPAYGLNGINWDEQPLGEMYDRDLAEILGVSTTSVCSQRNQRGIPVMRYPKTMKKRISVIRNTTTKKPFVNVFIHDFPIEVGDTVRVERDHAAGTITLHIVED